MTDKEMLVKVGALLGPPDWTEVKIEKRAMHFSISGRYHGRFHAGVRANAISLATDIDRIAKEEHARDNPAPKGGPVIETPPAPAAHNPYVVPDELAAFVMADESPTDFRERVKRLWQRFGIADGQHFPGGEALTSEEKVMMREIDIANERAGNWLRA